MRNNFTRFERDYEAVDSMANSNHVEDMPEYKQLDAAIMNAAKTYDYKNVLIDEIQKAFWRFSDALKK